MAIETQGALFFPVERSVAGATVFFDIGMSFDDLARHDERLYLRRSR